MYLQILCAAAAENRKGAYRYRDRNRYVGRNVKFQIVVVSREERLQCCLQGGEWGKVF